MIWKRILGFRIKGLKGMVFLSRHSSPDRRDEQMIE